MNAAETGTIRLDESSTGRHIPALDGVRGLAILLVFAYHFLWSNPDAEGLWVVRIFARAHGLGWVGVDLFFALSGFLITGILYDTLRSPRFFRNFYARRSLRIFPLYYGVLLLFYLATRVSGDHWNTFGTLRILTYSANLFYLPHPGPLDVWWLNVNHFWSLATEEQFYLVWPLAVFLLRTRRRIAIVALCGAFASLFVRLTLQHTGMAAKHPYMVYGWTPSHLDGLFLGAILAMVVRSHYSNYALRRAGVAFLISFCALSIFTWFHPSLNFIEDVSVAVWGIPLLAITFTALIAFSLKPGSLANRFFSTQTLRFFGKYSYGLYVYHYSISNITQHFRIPVATATHSKMLGVLIPAFVGLLLTIAVSWLSFNFFEARFLLLKRHFHDETAAPKLHDVLPAA